jgi:hypothetical protein
MRFVQPLGRGWVEYLTVPISPASVRVLAELRERIENYPVLDDEDFAQTEWDDDHPPMADATHRPNGTTASRARAAYPRLTFRHSITTTMGGDCDG